MHLLLRREVLAVVLCNMFQLSGENFLIYFILSMLKNHESSAQDDDFAPEFTNFIISNSYRELFDHSPQCKECTADFTTTPFCNIDLMPMPDYRSQVSIVFGEPPQEDYCYCDRTGSIFFAKDTTIRACTRSPDICKVLAKDAVCRAAGLECDGSQWSTFHCVCKDGMQGQLCDVPASAGQVVKNPILIHYLYVPLLQKPCFPIPEPGEPGLYFVTENLGDDFRLIVDFGDGRRIQVGPSKFVRKNYKEECLRDIEKKINFVGIRQCNLIPEGNLYGYGIFIDKGLEIDLHAKDVLQVKNRTFFYSLKYPGRFANINIQVRNKNKVTWMWDTFKVYVPHVITYQECSVDVKIQGCGRDAPVVKSIDSPLLFKASHDFWPWKFFQSLADDCPKYNEVNDQRWYIEDITDPEKLDDWIPEKQLPELYSLGAEGNRKVVSPGELGLGKYVIIYDFTFSFLSWQWEQKWEEIYLHRKLCYFNIVADQAMKVYVHTRSKSSPCKKPFYIDVENYNPYVYDNQHLRISWACEDSLHNSCGVKETRGIEQYTDVLSKCGVMYTFTATVTHPKTTKPETFKVEINSEVEQVEVKIECSKSCRLKVNPDRILHLRAREIPPISSSWTWEAKEITESETGDEIVGKDDLVEKMRQSGTLAHIFIIPRNKLTPGKQYRVYASTPAAFTSYSFIANSSPEPASGKCTIKPTSGETLVTEFLVSCTGWKDEDLPLSYRVYEIPELSQSGIEAEPLEDSEMSDLTVKLRRKNIMIWVVDSLGYHSEQNFTVSLSAYSKRLSEVQINETISGMNYELVGNDLEGALSDIDYLTKEIEEGKLQISEHTALKLLDILFRIDHFDDPFFLEKAINVLNRILNTKTYVRKLHTDKITLQGSNILNMYSDIAEEFSIRDKLELLDRGILSASISEASCAILKEKDPIVEQDSEPENIHEEHVQQMNRATNNSLKAMGVLGRMLIKHVKYQEQKYVTLKSCFFILTKNGNASQIRNESNNQVHFSDEYYKDESANVAILSVTDETKLKAPNEIGIMGIVAEFSDSVPEKKGPVDITMTVPNYHSRKNDIAGEYRIAPACATKNKLDRSFDIHDLQLPDGDGVVVLNFANDMVGKVKLFAQQGYQPNYENTSSSSILSSTDTYVRFSNRNRLRDSSFYVALVGATEESRKMEYTFTSRFLRCAVYNDVRFISRGCTFQKLEFQEAGKDPTIHCRCNLSSEAKSSTSWYSVNVVVPDHRLVLLDDVPLYSAVNSQYYASYPVSFLYLALFFLLLVGYRLDRTNDKLRNVIFLEDNYPGDDHTYVVAVFTGQGIGSGTSSLVGVRIFGKQSFSRVHLLNHSGRQTLKGGHDDWFLMTTSERLGRLTKIQLWHNHSGESPEWYCSKISVFDLKDHTKYDFFVERWFTFDVRLSIEDAQKYEGRPASEKELSKKWHLLVGGWIFSEMREKNFLAGVFRWHPRSLYTRCQRVIIGVTFAMSTMLISMMFFTLESGPADFPLLPFTWSDIWNGIQSSLISTAITFGVVFCFGKHKKYELAALNKEPKFEVVDRSERKRRRKKAKESETNQNQMKWLKKTKKIIKPTPIDYKPVIFGVPRTKPHRLSTIFLFTGWIIACLTIMFMSVLIVKYGMNFGPKKTLVWGLTFLTGTFTQGVVIGPIKVVIFGFIVAQLFKKSYLDSYTMQIKVDSTELARKKYLGRLKWNFKMRLRDAYKPAYTVDLEDYRDKRLNDRGFKYMLAHLVMVILLGVLAILLMVFMEVRESFYHISHLTALFTEETMYGDADGVRHEPSMFQFFSKTAIPAVHRVRWYNNKTLPVERNERKENPDSPRYQSHVRGFMEDYVNKLVGVPRLRQLRLSNSSFNNRRVPRIMQRRLPSGNLSGVGPYNRYYGMDRNSYHPLWVPYDGYHGPLEDTWSYSTSRKSGKEYSGGGYITELSWNLGGSLRTLKILEIRNWVTNRTRCIFLDINLFNNNEKHFSVVRFVVETLPAGPYMTSFQIGIISMHLSARPEAQATLAFVTVLLFMLIVNSLICVWHSSREGLMSYISSWRGASDMVLIVVGILAMSSQYNSVLRSSISTEYLDTIARNVHPVLFFTVATKEQADGFFCAFVAILAVNMCCTMFKFKMYHGMNRVLSTVWPLGLAGCIMLGFYSTLFVGLQSTVLDTNLGSLFILKFLFKDEKFHKFNGDSKVFYIIFAPCIILLFMFHLGYLVYSFNAYKEPWMLPTFSIRLHGFKKKKPKPLGRRATGQSLAPKREIKGILKKPKDATQPSANQSRNKQRERTGKSVGISNNLEARTSTTGKQSIRTERISQTPDVSSQSIESAGIPKESYYAKKPARAKLGRQTEETKYEPNSKSRVNQSGPISQRTDSFQSIKNAGTSQEPDGRNPSAKGSVSQTKKTAQNQEESVQSIKNEASEEPDKRTKPPGSQTRRKTQRKDDSSQLIK
ncbi:hypothetical protein GE061_002966 [Apolygus lucorum]|uniref:Uncharacterized protein n=1 Tax=Apolygus lucorum TaxID=248454 RepID=A0A6A4JMG4_APOLU|nr:hypothetical protein GE061_002966 [Apolygus lucorum]